MSGPKHRESEAPEGDAFRSVEIDLSSLLDEQDHGRDSIEVDLSSFAPRPSDFAPSS